MIKLLILPLFFLSCTNEDYTCEVTIQHIDQTNHDLPLEVSIGYETMVIPPNQSTVIQVFKNVEHLVCINSFSAKNQGHTSIVRIYSGFSYGGKLVVEDRIAFDNRPQLCAFSIFADDECNFKVIR